MQDVKRYKVVHGCLYYGTFGQDEGWSRFSGELVKATDYDALRAEVARIKQISDNYASLLMDANQEIARLRDLIRRLDKHLSYGAAPSDLLDELEQEANK